MPGPKAARVTGLQIEEAFEQRSGATAIRFTLPAIDDDEAGGTGSKLGWITRSALTAGRPPTGSLRAAAPGSPGVPALAGGAIGSGRLAASRLGAPGRPGQARVARGAAADARWTGLRRGALRLLGVTR